MAQQTFRTALNGFNRDDVVHYIEFLNAQHSAEVARLQSELEFLRSSTIPTAAAEEKVDIVGPKGTLKACILGPARPASQV